MISSIRLGLLNENLHTRHGILPYGLLVSEVTQNTKTTQVIVTVFGCLPELNGEILLLKMQ